MRFQLVNGVKPNMQTLFEKAFLNASCVKLKMNVLVVIPFQKAKTYQTEPT